MSGKSVYCPRCKRKVATWDGKSKINVKARCNKCKNAVLYHVGTDETEIISSDTRKTISGVTFY